MNKRLILPVIIMLASVLLLAGLMNFQAGSAEELPDSDNSGPTMEEPETISQKAVSTPATMLEATSNNSSSLAPAPAPTMMGSMGAASVPTVKAVASVVDDNDDLVVKANFTYGVECLTVSFNDMSENATSLEWDFGDGTNSTLQNPSHTYAVNGTYTVVLTASGLDGSNDSIEKSVMVEDCSEKEKEEGPVEKQPENPVTQEVPEFPTVAIPMVAIIGMAFFFGRKQ